MQQSIATTVLSFLVLIKGEKLLKEKNIPYEKYDPLEPQQVHISYGEKEMEMVITWVTSEKTSEALVIYGEQKDIEKMNHPSKDVTKIAPTSGTTQDPRILSADYDNIRNPPDFGSSQDQDNLSPQPGNTPDKMFYDSHTAQDQVFLPEPVASQDRIIYNSRSKQDQLYFSDITTDTQTEVFFSESNTTNEGRIIPLDSANDRNQIRIIPLESGSKQDHIFYPRNDTIRDKRHNVYHLNENNHSSLSESNQNQFSTHFPNFDRSEIFDPMVASGSSSLFTDGGTTKRTFWVHRVHLKDLRPNTIYGYLCGANGTMSAKYTFRTPKKGSNWGPKLCLYGDLGLENPQSMTRLRNEAETGQYDAFIHIGDFAYDMHDDESRVGEAFMNMIQPVASRVPYMVAVGNHEEKYNFSNYKSTFSMPKYRETENMFYSFDLGMMHFIAVNTEAFYFLQYGTKPLVEMYNWLENDLKEATRAESRRERPWIVLYGHRPMYCSNDDGDDCSYRHCLTRVGLPFLQWFGMEKLLMKYKVDLAIWAHEHSYERLWPLYDYHVHNGTINEPYKNPDVPVHFTTGSAGNKEREDHFKKEKPSWCAFRSTDYGYTRMSLANRTHLHWEQISDDQGGFVIDQVWLIKEKYKISE